MSGAADLQQIVTGLTRMARTRPDMALRQARSLLEQFPRLVPVQCLAANLARHAGDLEGAERHLEAALAEDPEAPPALAEKGVLAATRNDYTEAARCFRRLIEGGHRRPDLLFNLALAEEHLGHYERAAEVYRETLAATPDGDPEIRARLGGVLAATGNLDAARAELEAVLAADPDCIEALVALGMTELGAGRMDEAIRHFRACIERQPECAEAWQQVLESRRLEDPADPDLESVRSLLARQDLPPASRERLGFALGKACDDLGLYDEAFEHVREANDLKRQRLPAFDRDAWASECARRLEGALQPEEPRRARRPVTAVPIFIIGMPRSGTTLVDQILTSHPEVAGVGELAFFESRVDDEEGLRTAYLERLGATGARYVTNKFPGNFRHLPLIRRLFPEARIVHAVRDPVDTCLSIYFQDFPTGNFYANDFADIAAYWQGYRTLTEAWLGPGSGVFTARYEALTGDLEATARRLLAYCGLSWSADCLDFHRNPAPVTTLSRWQVRQPIFARSAGRWRNYEAHLEPLIEALGVPTD